MPPEHQIIPTDRRELLAAWLQQHERELQTALRPLAAHALSFRKQSLEETVSELLVETVQNALQSASRFDSNRSVRFWLLGIAGNVVKRWREEDATRSKRTVSYSQHSADEDGEYSEFLDHVFAATEASLEHDVVESMWLASLLSQLEPAEARIVLLIKCEQWNFEEVGGALGISAGAARVRLHRALISLRKLSASESLLLASGGTQ